MYKDKVTKSFLSLNCYLKLQTWLDSCQMPIVSQLLLAVCVARKEKEEGVKKQGCASLQTAEKVTISSGSEISDS